MGELHFDIAIIGGGAAGFFAAIHSAQSGKKVVILEKTSKLLSKVKVSGGGRCNVTHDCDSASELIKYYPRGGRSLLKGFQNFGTQDTVEWFESRGVKLKIEEDGRIFPVSDDSQSIINCLLGETAKLGIKVLSQTESRSIKINPNGFEIALKDKESLHVKKVIICAGGSNKMEAYQWLKELGFEIAKPIPSLFTFNVPNSDLKNLMGLSVNHGIVQVPGTKWKMDGPILITHWGFSAPAIIKLSSWGAIDFFEREYEFPILINWTGKNEEEVRSNFEAFRQAHPKKVIYNNRLFDIPSRLWQKLCDKSEIDSQLIYSELPKKKFNKLLELLVRSDYSVKGKTTFKEEFVTCGGVELSEVNLSTFESKKIRGLYFAGEVLNVDGLTGGFNFQHAWTSGYLAGRNASL